MKLAHLKKAIIAKVISILDHPWAARTILGVSLILTLGAWYFSQHYIDQRAEDQFNFRAQQVRSQIKKRMLEYEQVLRGGVGLFESSDTVSRIEWYTYIGNCDLQKYYPGIQGMGFAEAVQRNQKNDHVARVQAEGFSKYKVYPAGDRELYTPATYLEPFNWRNQRAFGFDMYSEPIRRAAIDRAIKTGLPTISGRIQLKMETGEDMQHGFLCYLPMYTKGADLDTAEHRRAAFQGLVYAAFRAGDLMHGIMQDDSQGINLEVFDQNVMSDQSLMFDSDEVAHFHRDAKVAKYSTALPLALNGRIWTLHLSAQDNFQNPGDGLISLLIGFGGLTVDLLLFIVIASIGRQKKRALTLAHEITHDLRSGEQLTRSILTRASEAIITIDHEGQINLFNDAAQSMFEIDSSAAIGLSFGKLLYDRSWPALFETLKNNHGQSSLTVKGIRASGELFPCRMALSTLDSGSQRLYIIVALDETARLFAEKQLADLNQQLIDTSHKTGKAEVATGVLHNVGNVLNSLNISAEQLTESLRDSRSGAVRKTVELLLDQDDLSKFFRDDPQGPRLINYLDQATKKALKDETAMESELTELLEHIDHIKQIIRVQQNQSDSYQLIRDETISELMDNAEKINQTRTRELDIQIHRNYGQCPIIKSDRHKIMQILVNLVKNAQDALDEVEDRQRIVTLTTEQVDEHRVRLTVADNGIGIPEELIEKVLQFGFTTKDQGHGFGLHSCLIAAQKIGAQLTVASDGLNCGTRFELTIPVDAEADIAPDASIPFFDMSTSGPSQVVS